MTNNDRLRIVLMTVDGGVQTDDHGELLNK